MTVWLTGLVALPSAIWVAGILKWLGESGRKSVEYAEASTAVVVVARNEERTIVDCLDSIAKQSTPAKEIVLMDDYSTDKTVELAIEVARVCANMRVVHMVDGIARVSPKKRALSAAFELTSSDRVALTDADCAVTAEWLQSLSAELDSETGAVIGASWPCKPTTFSERIYRWERLIANTLMASACGWGSPASACGHSILYKREALKKVDAPVRRDLPSGDDDLTVQAVAKAGYKVCFCAKPESVVTDLGGLRGSRWSQAARHQSVTHLYPIQWRLLFAATIISNLLSIFLLLLLPAFDAPTIPSVAILLKTCLEATAGRLLARKLRLEISVLEIFLASFVLPFWVIWRAAASIFGKSFDWRGRKMKTSRHAVSA
ncbi:MAG: glycosyltransferase [bacterium]|nr:glycosyltransferase [bacterium]